jgi:hypothetical protein
MALAPLRLPRLQQGIALTDPKTGKPSAAFVRYWNVELLTTIERQINDIAAIQDELAAQQLEIIAVNERQDVTDANLQDQIDRLTAILAGTGETFTGLSVGGINVKPFLDNTDGTKIDTTAGLGLNVVETTTVLAGSITPPYYAFTAGTVVWTTEATEKTLQTLVVGVVRGDVRISALCDVFISSLAGASSLGTLRLRRDGTEIFDATRFIGPAGSTGTWRFPSQIYLEYFDSPGAGSFTYTLTFEPGETVDGQIVRRSLTSQPQEG